MVIDVIGDDDYYQQNLYKLRDMIQQDVYSNRADMCFGKVDKVSGSLLEDTLVKYLEKIEIW